MFFLKLDRRLSTKLLTVAPGILAAATKREVKKIAHWARNEIRSRIMDQRYKHKKLTARYLRWKKRNKLDPGTLMATRSYVHAIYAKKISHQEYQHKIKKRHGKVWSAWEVGVPNITHAPSGLPMRTLAAIHEYGSKAAHIPARPHWRPVWRLLKGKKAAELLQEIRRTTMWELRRIRRMEILGG